MKTNEVFGHYIHISAKRRWYELKLAEVWKYRDLILLLTRRNFVLTFKQTILGPIWIFLNPFITSVIFSVVFGGIAGINTDGIPQILFYLCSNALWGFFAECVNKNASTFVANAQVFGKVYFPRLVVPISNVVSSLIRLGIQMILLVMFLIYYICLGQVHPNWGMWFLIPLSLIQLAVLGMGVGILISSLTTKYRDLSILVGFGVSLWMYATPIVYPLSQTQNQLLQKLLLINPVTTPVEVIRYVLLGKGTIILVYAFLSWLITFLLAVLGLMLFNYVEKTFMDTV